jgi:hypothetical protein
MRILGTMVSCNLNGTTISWLKNYKKRMHIQAGS